MSGLLGFFQSLWEIIKLLKAGWVKWQDFQESKRRDDFKEGVENKDTTKIEGSFDSGQAGVPDKIGDIEWDDEKTN